MKTYRNLYKELCSYENLELAFIKARKRKTLKDYVIKFESELSNNLEQLRQELESFTYAPGKMTEFIVRDPKTRRIGAFPFRDRIVHHAICNVIQPIFEKDFIYDSFANQKNKGTHLAIKRLEKFIRKVSVVNKNTVTCGGFALRADVRHYFDSVDHKILLEIIKRKIKDDKLILLIKNILENHKQETIGKGIPLGNLTSQFFANVYLNELDKFVKHVLKARYYIRYVDDFIILHKNKAVLEKWKNEISNFLRSALQLELHPEKSRIISLNEGITMLGFRVFYRYRLLKKSNARRIWKRLERFKNEIDKNDITITDALKSIEGWMAYAKFANTHKLRQKVFKTFVNSF
jgi:retron-type reverse transcriptase